MKAITYRRTVLIITSLLFIGLLGFIFFLVNTKNPSTFEGDYTQSTVKPEGAYGGNTHGIYLSLNTDKMEHCQFGEANGCHLVYVVVEEENGTYIPDIESVEFVLDDIPAVMPDINPSGTHLAFMASGTTSEVTLRNIYIHSFVTGETEHIDTNETKRGNGTWPNWQDDERLIFTNSISCNNCTEEDANSQKVFVYDIISKTTKSYFETEFSTCDLNDLFFQSNQWFAGHSESFVQDFDDDCALTQEVPINQQGKDFGPQPWVINQDADTPRVILFDQTSAGINACAHFSTDGETWICTEQNTIENPYKLCSIPTLDLHQCQEAGGHIILYNRLFGWELSESKEIFESTRGEQPLFEHRHPASLPEVERYWDPVREPCQVYKTKQAQINGDTVLAHIYCQSENNEGQTSAERHITHFSRIFLINIKNPNQPSYYDLTSWFEDQFNLWNPGEAESYTSTLLSL